jgi:hypothetical protein
MAISFDLSETFEVKVGKLAFTFRHPSAREMAKISRRIRKVYDLVATPPTGASGEGGAEGVGGGGGGGGEEAVLEEMIGAMSPVFTGVVGIQLGSFSDLPDRLTMGMISHLFNGFAERVVVTEKELGESSSRGPSEAG